MTRGIRIVLSGVSLFLVLCVFGLLCLCAAIAVRNSDWILLAFTGVGMVYAVVGIWQSVTELGEAVR